MGDQFLGFAYGVDSYRDNPGAYPLQPERQLHHQHQQQQQPPNVPVADADQYGSSSWPSTTSPPGVPGAERQGQSNRDHSLLDSRRQTPGMVAGNRISSSGGYRAGGNPRHNISAVQPRQPAADSSRSYGGSRQLSDYGFPSSQAQPRNITIPSQISVGTGFGMVGSGPGASFTGTGCGLYGNDLSPANFPLPALPPRDPDPTDLRAVLALLKSRTDDVKAMRADNMASDRARQEVKTKIVELQGVVAQQQRETEQLKVVQLPKLVALLDVEKAGLKLLASNLAEKAALRSARTSQLQLDFLKLGAFSELPLALWALRDSKNVAMSLCVQNL